MCNAVSNVERNSGDPMGQFELNDALSRFTRRRGQPGLNASGKQGSRALRAARREFKDQLIMIAKEPCDIPDHAHTEPITKIECLARRLWNTAAAPERWAISLLLLRMEGRVPLDIDIQQVSVVADLRTLFDESQRARYRELIDIESRDALTPGEADELFDFRHRAGAKQLTGGSDAID